MVKSAKSGRSQANELSEKIVHVARCTKVVKGGRKFRFSALVVVGDRRGFVGVGLGKALEVADACMKAKKAAMRSMFRVPLKKGKTIHHDVSAYFGGCKVVMRSASSGTGIIAGGVVRSMLEVLGVRDIVVKCIGTTNPHNALKAAKIALTSISTPRAIAEKRGKKVSQILDADNFIGDQATDGVSVPDEGVDIDRNGAASGGASHDAKANGARSAASPRVRRPSAN